jgi:diguanylate cyclase (GGDEF)-like protein
VVARQWGAFRDVERLLRTVRRQEERLRHRATHDPLTQLANRTLLGEQLEATLDDPARGSATVLLIDLDNFKTVNDSLGHAVGDELLVTVAGRLKACVRGGDLVCRLGGDEFVILLADVDTLTASHIAQRIVDRLAEPVSAGGHTLTCNASLGIAAAEPGDGSGRLLSKADIAMYAAKRAGKSSFTWYDASADVAGQNTESTAAAHPTPAHR